MKKFHKSIAFVLLLAQLLLVPVRADTEEVALSAYETILSAFGGTAVTSGAVRPENAAPSSKTATDETKETKPAEASKEEAEEKDEEEYKPVTKFGTEGDVMMGGLEIHPGVWYTVIDGVLTSAPPWPDSYLYYSASQSKITLHEFHYKVSSDKTGKDDTFAALYIPKDMHIVLEGENELINAGYSKTVGSNGVYARDYSITFDGNGTLAVNTRPENSGYGVAAGSIRIEGEFIGLSVFGGTSAFSVAPRTKESREMIARRADLHPDYNGDVKVRDASPYDTGMYTRNRYVLLAVGKKLSHEQEIRARIEAEYARVRSDYDEAVDNAWDETLTEFNQSVDQEIASMQAGLDEWQTETTVEPFALWGEGSAGSELAQMMITGGN